MLTSLLSNAIYLAAAWFFLAAAPAQAYFDLNFGNYLVQLLFAFGAAAWFSFRHTFRTWFGPKTPIEKQPVATDAQKPDNNAGSGSC